MLDSGLDCTFTPAPLPGPPQPSLPASKAFLPWDCGPLPLSSYVDASKLRTEQHRWKEHESRARSACKIMAYEHLFITTVSTGELFAHHGTAILSLIILKAEDAPSCGAADSTGSLTPKNAMLQFSFLLSLTSHQQEPNVKTSPSSKKKKIKVSLLCTDFNPCNVWTKGINVKLKVFYHKTPSVKFLSTMFFSLLVKHDIKN